MSRFRYLLSLSFVFLFPLMIPLTSAQALTVTFEDLQLGSRFYGQPFFGESSFESGGVQISVQSFNPPLPFPYPQPLPPGVLGYDQAVPFFLGHATVTDDGLSTGSGNEIALDHALLDFGIAEQVNGLSLNFGGNSGMGFISINNERRIVSSLYELSGESLGGVDIGIAVADSIAGPDTGLLQLLVLSGNIKQFSVGGVQLSLDNVHFADNGQAEVPEPGSLLLLGAALIGLRRCRSRS